MKTPGQIVLVPFPRTDQTTRRLRPTLLIARLPGPYDDWLTCIISSQLWHYVDGFDEIIDTTSPDFLRSGLKSASVVRVGRLAVIEGSLLFGSVGEVAPERLERIKTNLAKWLTSV
jgi:mRNA interferase MazF